MSVRWRLGCSTFAALVAFRSGSGNMSAAGFKLWLRAEEAGPDPCPNNLSAVMDLYNGEIIPYETARRPVFKLLATCSTRHWPRWMTKTGQSCIPVRVGSIRCRPGAACSKAAISPIHVTQGQLLRQRRRGELLRHAQIRVLPSQSVQQHRKLRDGVEDYIRCDNNDRITMKLKGLSPVQYRTQPSNHPSL